MVDDEVSWTDRIDPSWISAQVLHCISHRSKVNYSGNPTRWREVRETWRVRGRGRGGCREGKVRVKGGGRREGGEGRGTVEGQQLQLTNGCSYMKSERLTSSPEE